MRYGITLSIASERMDRRYQICIVRCLYSYRDDFPETLGKTTAPEFKKSSWTSSLKNRTPFASVSSLLIISTNTSPKIETISTSQRPHFSFQEGENISEQFSSWCENNRQPYHMFPLGTLESNTQDRDQFKIPYYIQSNVPARNWRWQRGIQTLQRCCWQREDQTPKSVPRLEVA